MFIAASKGEIVLRTNKLMLEEGRSAGLRIRMGPSVFDLSVSGRSLAGSEGPGPLKQKTKTGVFFGRYGASTEP